MHIYFFFQYFRFTITIPTYFAGNILLVYIYIIYLVFLEQRGLNLLLIEGRFKT